MKQDKWTQQLREKLAEHETAAPDGLWEDIEATLAQQSALAASSSGSRSRSRSRSRFVAMRRWAVAASVAALLLGGGYLWWSTQPVPASQGEELLAQSLTAPQGEEILPQPFPAPVEKESLAQPLPAPVEKESLAQPLPSPQGEGLGVGSETSSDRAPEIQSGEVIQTPPQTPPLEGRGVATQEESQQQIMNLQQWQDPELPVAKPKHQVTLGLFAMNGLDNQSSANGVQMAGALAKQYMETYANSYSAARSSEPIWLSGYEERQHHHRPVTYGLTLSYPFSDRLSLTTGVVYTKLNSDFTQVMRSQQILQEQTLHYVGIPLNMRYRLWQYKGFSTYLAAGVKADWNVATHLETEGVSQQLPKDRLQWSLNGSLGVQYDLLPQLGCYVEPSMNWYPDNGSAIRNYFKDKPLSFGLQIGLRLCLKE